MAALAAPPMVYRTFVATPSAPVIASHLAGGAGAAVQPPVQAERAADFPLLLAALPEVAQISVPQALALGNATPGRPLPRTPDQPAVKPEKTWARSPEAELSRPTVQPSRTESFHEQTMTRPKSMEPRSSALSFRQVQAGGALKKHGPVPPKAADNATPLATMFQALHDVSPPGEPVTKARLGPQNLFSRL
jgi:hypothetical protein